MVIEHFQRTGFGKRKWGYWINYCLGYQKKKKSVPHSSEDVRIRMTMTIIRVRSRSYSWIMVLVSQFHYRVIGTELLLKSMWQKQGNDLNLEQTQQRGGSPLRQEAVDLKREYPAENPKRNCKSVLDINKLTHGADESCLYSSVVLLWQPALRNEYAKTSCIREIAGNKWGRL